VPFVNFVVFVVRFRINERSLWHEVPLG